MSYYVGQRVLVRQRHPVHMTIVRLGTVEESLRIDGLFDRDPGESQRKWGLCHYFQCDDLGCICHDTDPRWIEHNGPFRHAANESQMQPATVYELPPLADALF